MGVNEERNRLRASDDQEEEQEKRLRNDHRCDHRCDHGDIDEAIRGERLAILEREVSRLRQEEQRIVELVQDEVNEMQAMLHEL